MFYFLYAVVQTTTVCAYNNNNINNKKLVHACINCITLYCISVRIAAGEMFLLGSTKVQNAIDAIRVRRILYTSGYWLVIIILHGLSLFFTLRTILLIIMLNAAQLSWCTTLCLRMKRGRKIYLIRTNVYYSDTLNLNLNSHTHNILLTSRYGLNHLP